MSASVDQKFETFVEENLQERQVTDGAKGADPMQAASIPAPQDTAKQNTGGPTNQNYKSDDNSSKITVTGTSQVKDKNNAKAKPAEGGKGKLKEEEEISETEEVIAEGETTEEFNVDEDVNALIAGEELSEEFKEKTKVIFEAAIKAKVAKKEKEMKKEYDDKMCEELETVKAELAEKMDKFLAYVAEEWRKENELAITQGIKLEVMENFMAGVKGLFEENYVSIPEDKYDVLEEMTNKLDEMEGKLNEQIEKNMSLNGKINTFVKESLIVDVSKGLAQTQAEKLASLAEGLEFESEESFRGKLETIKENYFPKAKVELKEDIATEEVASSIEGPMAAYVQAISRWK